MKKQTKQAVDKNSKNFYAPGTYKPNKNAVPVEYNGKTYLSKAQCMAMEGITRKELDAYLNGEPLTAAETVINGATEEELANTEVYGDLDLVNAEDLV